jgi:hypothetical protein
MTIDKRCISPGCSGYPLFGFGMPSKGLMRWACKSHRDIIWNAATPAPGEGGPADVSRPVPPSPPAVQGRLL